MDVKGTAIVLEDDIDGDWWVSALPSSRLLEPIAEAIQSDHHTVPELAISLTRKLGNLVRPVKLDFSSSNETILINRECRTVAIGDHEVLRIVGWDSFFKTRMENARCIN